MTTAAALPAHIAERRRQVAELRRDKLTIRDIAKRIGVGRTTVQRDIHALEEDMQTPADQDEGTPDEAVPPGPEDTVGPDGTDGGTVSGRPQAMAPMSLILAADPALLDDLAVLTSTGICPEAAARHAIGFMAAAYRQAWDAGIYPHTTTPVIGHYTFATQRSTRTEDNSPTP
ncbi:helix-turn-helix domain-containing protein [Streptomyces sp. NPDC094032]|uniref:helix-turn-helix domain-containing protein n=1 Tax=Streptomyces sp. NPDC094032 TaxID=3155308 RepID=UPI003332EFF2